MSNFEVLDVVRIKEGVTKYSNGKSMASWVPSSKLYVRKISGNEITISTLKEGAITGIVWATDLVLVEKAKKESPQLYIVVRLVPDLKQIKRRFGITYLQRLVMSMVLLA